MRYRLALLLLAVSTAFAGTFTSSVNCAFSSQSISDYNPTSLSCHQGVASASSSTAIGNVIAESNTTRFTAASAGASWSGNYWVTITGGTGGGRWLPTVTMSTISDISDTASASMSFGGYSASQGNLTPRLYGGGCPWGNDFGCAKPFTFGVPFLVAASLSAFASSQNESEGSYATASFGLVIQDDSRLNDPSQFAFTLTDVPEPGTWGLVLAGIAAAASFRKFGGANVKK